MRRKMSTILDESLYRRLRLESARDGSPISDILANALETYLDARRSPRGEGGVVSASWGVLRLASKSVRRILAEEGLFDS